MRYYKLTIGPAPKKTVKKTDTNNKNNLKDNKSNEETSKDNKSKDKTVKTINTKHENVKNNVPKENTSKGENAKNGNSKSNKSKNDKAEKDKAKEKKAKDDKEKTLIFTSYVSVDDNGSGYKASANPQGHYDYRALDIEFKVDMVHVAQATLGSITLDGVDIDLINQAANMSGRTVELQAGFGNGYSLCDPSFSGLILRGVIAASVGIWQDSKMALQLYVKPYIENEDIKETDPDKKPSLKTDHDKADPVKDPYVFTVKKGALLADALKNCVNKHFTDYKMTFRSAMTKTAKSDKDFSDHYPDFDTFAKTYGVEAADKSMWHNATKQDLYIFPHDKTIYFADGSEKNPVKKIKFEELIGQPSWDITATSLKFQCPMRSDIIIGDRIMLPTFMVKNNSNLVTNTSTNNPSSKQQSIFSGIFFITQVEYNGHFRGPLGTDWCATYTAKQFTPPDKDDDKNKITSKDNKDSKTDNKKSDSSKK